MSEDSIFDEARKLAPAERGPFLAARCADPQMRRHIEELLQAHDVGGLLDQPADQMGLTVAAVPKAGVEQPGMLIGSYKLLQKLGEGGMGAVWAAEQSVPVKRRVALKLIKAGMDSTNVLRRFEAERQALALMEHPNVAKVLDVGTTPQGRPYPDPT